MRQIVLLDTGPLVAGIDERDQHHSWAVSQLGRLRAPLFTCEAVLSEACFLLARVPGGVGAIGKLLQQGAVVVSLKFTGEGEQVIQLMEKYASVPMSFADACLVRMTEQHSKSSILTIDKDFTIYRRNGRQPIPTIMPDGA